MFNLGHLSQVTYSQEFQMVIIKEVHNYRHVIHNQVNVKWNTYSNTYYVAYLHELTDILFLYQCDEAAGPQKSSILLFALVYQR
jgi:hypothetical protein